MSLLWADKVSVALYPDRVVLLRQQGGLVKRIVHKQIEQCLPENHSAVWMSALTELDAMLAPAAQAEPVSYAHCHLHVVLSAPLLRYLSLPPLEIAMNAEEKLAVVRGSFQEIYGAEVDAWQLHYHDAAPDEAMIAVAIDTALINGLSAVAQKHQMRVQSVRPHLMQAYNLLRGQIQGKHTYFAVLEPQRVLWCALQSGKWRSLKTFPREADVQRQLMQLTQREQWLHEQQVHEHQLYVFASEMDSFDLPNVSGWRMTWCQEKRLENMLALNEKAMRMAAGALL